MDENTEDMFGQNSFTYFDQQSESNVIEMATESPVQNQSSFDRNWPLLLLLSVCFVVGVPLNLAVFKRLLSRIKSRQTSRGTLLKFHLNISDLMVFFVYVASRVIWEYTLEWKGGMILCKLVKFGHVYSYLLSSAILAAIALDRLNLVLRPFQPSQSARSYIKVLILLSYIYAAVFSIPQLLTWTTVIAPPFPNSTTNITQCSTIFFIADYENKSTHFLQEMSNIWNVVHLATVFLIPLTVICICYAVMILQVCRHHVRATSEEPQESSTTYDLKNMGLHNSNTGNALSTRNVQESVSPTRQSLITQPGEPRRESSSLIRTSTSHVTDCELGPRVSMRVTLRMVKTALLLITAYIVCWLPYTLIALREFFYKPPTEHVKLVLDEISTYLNQLIVINSMVNPLLYGFQMTELKSFLETIGRCCYGAVRCCCCFCCLYCRMAMLAEDETTNYSVH